MSPSKSPAVKWNIRESKLSLLVRWVLSLLVNNKNGINSVSFFPGQIELYYDRGNHHEFVAFLKELARPGDLLQNTSYPFEFANVEKPYEVYVGSNVRLRYFLRVTIGRRLSDIIKEVDIAVHTLCSYPEMNSPIKMEVGIEDCLHIEFEYNKSK